MGKDNITKLPGTEVTTEWVYVDPELAMKYLDTNIDNRSKREKHLNVLEKDMKMDRYVLTHEGLAFDENDVLIDGQHRLVSIVRSGKPQWLLVTRNLSKEAKMKIDSPAKRTTFDFLPGKVKAQRNSAIRHYLALKQLGGKFTVTALKNTYDSITPSEVQEAWDSYEIEELAHKAIEASKTNVFGASALLATAMYFPEVGKDFLEGLITMEGLQKNDPRLQVLRYRGTGAGNNFSVQRQIYLLSKACKAFAEGRTITSLRLVMTDELKIW